MNQFNELPPSSYYAQIREWIDETFDKSTKHKFFQQFYSDETILFPKPKGVDPVRWNLKSIYRKPFVAIIPNGRIWSNSHIGGVITPNNKLIRDVVFPGWWKDFFNEQKMPPLSISEETIAVLSCGQVNNYYHWFLDILPRIHLLNNSGLQINKFLTEKIQDCYKMETLLRLGIKKDQILQINSERFHLKAKKVIVPSLPLYTGPCPKWACDYVRNNLLNKKSEKRNSSFERIYISREDSTYRKVINDNEVTNFLSNKGFKKIMLTPLTLEEKINIFASAKIIVSPVDAGLTNLLFCDPGAKVIELSANSMYCDVYWKISYIRNLDYYRMETEIAPPEKKDPPIENLIVNIEKLSKILRIAGV